MVKKSLIKSFVGKTVYDLMMAIPNPVNCRIIDVETDDFEFPDIVGFSSKMLTEEGHKKWDNILKKYIITNVNTDNLITIYVESKTRNDYGEALYVFEMCYAGYCSDSDYKKWFTDLSQTFSGFKTLIKHSHKSSTKKINSNPVCKNKVNKMVGNVKKYENSVRNML